MAEILVDPQVLKDKATALQDCVKTMNGVFDDIGK